MCIHPPSKIKIYKVTFRSRIRESMNTHFLTIFWYLWSDIDVFIGLRHMFRLIVVANLKFMFKKDLCSFTHAYHVMSYHLMWMEFFTAIVISIKHFYVKQFQVLHCSVDFLGTRLLYELVYPSVTHSLTQSVTQSLTPSLNKAFCRPFH